MQHVLVAGATGYLGRHVLRALRRRGYTVHALARSAAKLDDLGDVVDVPHIAPITDPAALQGVCEGVDAVFTSVGITRQRDGLTYMDVDYQGNKNLLDEAVQAGVSRFAYVSVFNAEGFAHLKGIEAKLRFTQALRNAAIDPLVIYPNGFFSDMLEYLEMARKGRVWLVGPGDCRINPIHGEDLAEASIDAFEQGKHELQIGGPDLLTHREIAARAFAALGKPMKIAHIPLWVRDLTLGALRTFTPVTTYGPLEFFLTVLAADLPAPPAGRHHIADFFREHAANN